MKILSIVGLLLLYSAKLYSSSVEAIYVKMPPKIDGTVDDAIWQQAAAISEFIQREPNTGEPVSEKTIAYICYWSLSDLIRITL